MNLIHHKVYVFIIVSVFIMLSIKTPLVSAQQTTPQPPPAFTSDTLILAPGTTAILVQNSGSPPARYLFLARQGETISLNAQRTAGDGVLVLKLSSAAGVQLDEGQSNDLAGDQTQLQFPVTVDGWYWLDATLDPNGGGNSGTFTLQLTGTTPYLMTLAPSPFPLMGTANAHMVDLFTLTSSPTTTVTLTPSITLTPSLTLTPSVTPSLTLTKNVSATPTPSLTWTLQPNTMTPTPSATLTPGSPTLPAPTLIPAGTILTPTVYGLIMQKTMAFVYVPPGCFLMGSDINKDPLAQADEQPQRVVCLTKGYYIGQYEVTNSQFAAYEQATGRSHMTFSACQEASNSANQPVVCVSWTEAAAYAKWFGCRLPTEAEWEYAARSPASWIYPWGDIFTSANVNSAELRVGQTSPVGSYAGGQSWVGAYDLAGNVWEWLADWYDAGFYAGRPNPDYDPTGPGNGTTRLLHGGSWDSHLIFARAAYRNNHSPENRYYYTGLRLVCPATIQPVVG